ncbi:unnamed protein product, partial [Pylaiella littoralis]
MQMLGENIQQKPRGRRPRRRSRSGDGVVLANRKTEICLHWQTGSCPYGAGSCAFAHGLGELRHPTLDDGAIAKSVSEDSESCPSPLDVVSPSSRRCGTIGRVPPSPCDRRLPTFVSLSTGTTPVTGGGHSGHFASPSMRRTYGYANDPQQGTTCHRRTQSFPSPSSAFSDSCGFGVAVDAPPLSPASFHRGGVSASSPLSSFSGQLHHRLSSTSSSATTGAVTAGGGGGGGKYRNYGSGCSSAASSPAGADSAPPSPVSWSREDSQKKRGEGGFMGGGGGGGGAAQP